MWWQAVISRTDCRLRTPGLSGQQLEKKAMGAGFKAGLTVLFIIPGAQHTTPKFSAAQLQPTPLTTNSVLLVIWVFGIDIVGVLERSQLVPAKS